MNGTLAGGELSLHDVRKTYAGQRGVECVDLDVKAGEFVTMLGPSGSGKTTTLNLIAGFLDADEGSITLDGRELSGVPPHKRELGVARKCLLRDKRGATVTARVSAGHDISELGAGREAVVAWDPTDAVLVPDS